MAIFGKDFYLKAKYLTFVSQKIKTIEQYVSTRNSFTNEG